MSDYICVPWENAPDYCIGSPEGFNRIELMSLGSIISNLMPYVFAIAGLVLLLMIIAAGYTMLTSAGNPEAIAKGKSRLTAGLIGFILVFAAYWILQIIEVFLGIQDTQWGFT